ncbi:MAG: hypothetical protein QG657_5634 [Acidobacteriota bacterium]|nr:hypothetical protein [Acidobacteriota bacterium]
MKDNFIEIKNPDQKIYRIFRIKRFKQLMRSKKLVLVNPKKWDDPFENFFLKEGTIDPVSGQTVPLENLAAAWYGQCWTFEKESDALWRIYSPPKDGLRVSTTIKKLFSCIWDEKDKYRSLKYFIGKVSYTSRSEIEKIMENTSFENISFGGHNDKFAGLLCIKRKEFSHEKEIRLLVSDLDPQKGKNGCYRIPFDYQNILEDVCLDPRLSVDAYSALKNDFEKMGCKLPITQSELYKVSFKPIRLQMSV